MHVREKDEKRKLGDIVIVFCVWGARTRVRDVMKVHIPVYKFGTSVYGLTQYLARAAHLEKHSLLV